MAAASVTGDPATLLQATAVASDAHRQLKDDGMKMKSWLTEGPWALRMVCFLACAFSTVVSAMTILGSPTRMVTNFYAGLFSFLCMILEAKGLMCTQRCKTRTEYWLKVLARTWGRGLAYLLIASMELTGGLLPFLSGLGMLVAAGASLYVSRSASKKVNEMQRALHKQYGIRDSERVREAFRSFDKDGSGALSPTELAAVAISLGAELSGDELSAILSLLDADRDGKIGYDEFEQWWRGDKEIDYSWV